MRTKYLCGFLVFWEFCLISWYGRLGPSTHCGSYSSLVVSHLCLLHGGQIHTSIVELVILGAWRVEHQRMPPDLGAPSLTSCSRASLAPQATAGWSTKLTGGLGAAQLIVLDMEQLAAVVMVCWLRTCGASRHGVGHGDIERGIAGVKPVRVRIAFMLV
jgi:hypothetical protein